MSFSSTPAGATDDEPTLDEMLAGPTVHDPVNQVISSEELRSLVACLSTVLSELESHVLALYLDGHSYKGIGERLGCDCKTVDNALQRVKRKVGAHLRSRDVLLYCSMPTWLIVLIGVSWRWSFGGTTPAARRRRGASGARSWLERSRGSPPRAPRTAAGTARARGRRPPGHRGQARGGTPTAGAHLVEVIDRPGTDEDQAVFRCGDERLTLGRRTASGCTIR